MQDKIDGFYGKYFFLSNFYPTPVVYNGMRFNNTEAAFQAAKCPEKMSLSAVIGVVEMRRNAAEKSESVQCGLNLSDGFVVKELPSTRILSYSS